MKINMEDTVDAVSKSKIEMASKIVNDLKLLYERDSVRKEILQKTFDDNVKLLKEKNDFVTNKGLESEILHQACEKAREKGRNLIATLGTEAVQQILKEPLSVEIQHEIKGGLPYDSLLLKSDYGISGCYLTNPAEEEGGGVADIVSLATFISLRMITGDVNKAPLFLDEPSKYVSKGNAENVANFLKHINEINKIQTFIITHEDTYIPEIANKHYDLILDENCGVSMVNNT